MTFVTDKTLAAGRRTPSVGLPALFLAASWSSAAAFTRRQPLLAATRRSGRRSGLKMGAELAPPSGRVVVTGLLGPISPVGMMGQGGVFQGPGSTRLRLS